MIFFFFFLSEQLKCCNVEHAKLWLLFQVEVPLHHCPDCTLSTYYDRQTLNLMVNLKPPKPSDHSSSVPLLLSPWSKVHFPSSSSQQSTLQNINAQQWRSPPRITAAIRFIKWLNSSGSQQNLMWLCIPSWAAEQAASPRKTSYRCSKFCFSQGPSAD